ncbi:Transporter [Penicillium chrysogenum]|uniref:Transporter n=1 Tax=Penicillium chrysogenum TaxID=5076 RepID=A0A167U695_PENCH|nr:Transporter [Penicillium chrysogenum]
MDTIRESPLGQLLRAITGNRILLYPEEKPGFVLPANLEQKGHPIESDQSLSDSPKTPALAPYFPPGANSEGGHAQDETNNIVGCLYTFAIYSGSSIYVPAAPVNASVLLDGLGPLLFSPLSEVPLYGRNIPYVTSFIAFVILCVPTALVENFAGFMVLRLLQGFFGSPCLASGGASMGDMYSDIYLPLGLTSWVAAAYGGPALGPVLSVFSIAEKGWRWAMWEILWMSAPILILMVICLPETSADNILLRRAERLRRFTGNTKLFSQSEITQNRQKFYNMLLDSLVKPVEIMVKDPAILFANVYTSLVYGIYYSFFEAFPLVYPAKYGFDAKDVALIFISIIIGCAVAVVVYIVYLYTSLMPDLKANGRRPHEHRLPPALFASFGPTIGLFIFAWTTNGSIHWAVSALGIVLYAGSVFIVLQCVLVYLSLAYPKYEASLFAGNDISRSAVAFAFILFSRFMFIDLGIDKGVTLLAGLSILGIIGMFILYFCGAGLRARSKFAEHS